MRTAQHCTSEATHPLALVNRDIICDVPAVFAPLY